MQEFLNWTVDTIREDRLISPWLEEKKYEWTPLVSILGNINSTKLNRPFLPYYDFKSFYRYIDTVKSDEDISYIKDMLSISFPNGYCFWYIGRSQDVRAVIPKVSKHSFLWLFDEEKQDAFNLKSNDEALDMKLLQMFRLYNKSVSASLFAEINVEN